MGLNLAVLDNGLMDLLALLSCSLLPSGYRGSSNP
jgi:hypothetical protein